MNFVEFLRTPFYIEHLWWLLLEIPFCQLVAFLFVVPQFVAFEFFNFHMDWKHRPFIMGSEILSYIKNDKEKAN